MVMLNENHDFKTLQGVDLAGNLKVKDAPITFKIPVYFVHFVLNSRKNQTQCIHKNPHATKTYLSSLKQYDRYIYEYLIPASQL